MVRLLVMLVLFLAAGVLMAQAAAPPSPQSSAPQAKPAPVAVPAAHPEAVNSSEAVITVHGFCPNIADKGSPACTTAITKEQFEKVLAAVNQSGAPMPPAAIRNLAERYVQILAFAAQAEKLGLDKDPKFQELMRITRLNSLAEAYHRSTGDRNAAPADDEIQAFYQKNLARFEQVRLGRIFIPRVNPQAAHDAVNDFEQRAQKAASAMRERAAKGEDLDKLEAEAYHTLGLTTPPPNTDSGTRRRGSFPPAVENDIFALKPGEVTRLEPEPAGFQFYRLQGRDTLTLAQVKNEIIAVIRKDHLEAANKAVLDPIHTDLNETYFGPRTAGAPLTIPPPHNPQTRPAPAPPGSAPKPGPPSP